MRVAVVGATGLVGGVMLKILEERNFPVSELFVVASERSVGKELYFKGDPYKVIGLQEGVDKKPDIAIFSAGGSISLEWAPKFAEQGTFVVDNSSAWRMDKTKPLVVPEINANILSEKDKIIANPNCSTIQMVMALAPLHKQYNIKRIVASTYQSVSGTGQKAVQQFENERNHIKGEMAYPYEIDRNCLPHCDSFQDNGYTKEEMKLVNETKKILDDDSLQITATAVRVPVAGGHSESINIEFEKGFKLDEVRKLLDNTPGIVVQDDPANNIYPMCLYAHGKDDVFVGRIREDFSCENTLNMWVVSDNLRKGAATNAVQIAEYLVDQGIVSSS